MTKRKLYWALSVSWILLIYSTLSFVRPLCTYLRSVLPFDDISNLIVFVPLVFIIGGVMWRMGLPRLSTAALVCVILTAYAFGVSRIAFAEEKIHFVQYGVMSFLLYKAFRQDFSAPFAYCFAALVNALLGWGDEGIQHFLPDRYYDIKDVCLNAVSGVMGLFVVWVMERERKLRGNLHI